MDTERKIERILLKPAEFAEAVGISRSKAYAMIASGTVKSVRLDNGRLVRVPVDELRRLAAGE